MRCPPSWIVEEADAKRCIVKTDMRSRGMATGACTYLAMEALLHEPISQPLHLSPQPMPALLLHRVLLSLACLTRRRRRRTSLTPTATATLLNTERGICTTRALSSYAHREEHRITSVHLPAQVFAAFRLRVIVGECIALPINVVLVY